MFGTWCPSFEWRPQYPSIHVRWYPHTITRAFDNVASDDFDGAKHQAEDWFAQVGATAVRYIVRRTVRDALDAYLGDFRRHGRPEAAREAHWRLRLAIYKDPIADLELGGGQPGTTSWNGGTAWSQAANRDP